MSDFKIMVWFVLLVSSWGFLVGFGIWSAFVIDSGFAVFWFLFLGWLLLTTRSPLFAWFTIFLGFGLLGGRRRRW